jgi:uncharacterized membrane protein YfcA
MLLALVAIIAVAGLAHGTLGFGFPIISTPVVALFTDIRTAILVTLFPNIVVNLISVLRGGRWRHSLGRHWPVAAYVLIGTVAGTHLLIAANPELLKLLLALMIAVYLLQGRIRVLDWSLIGRHPRGSAMLFGLMAGFLAGTVNVTVPPLVIYFMALGVESVALTQILNLCFLVGKLTQAITLAMSGQIAVELLVASTPLVALAVTALFLGLRIQSRIRAEVYQGLLRKVLWLMAFILLAQVSWHYLR